MCVFVLFNFVWPCSWNWCMNVVFTLTWAHYIIVHYTQFLCSISFSIFFRRMMTCCNFLIHFAVVIVVVFVVVHLLFSLFMRCHLFSSVATACFSLAKYVFFSIFIFLLFCTIIHPFNCIYQSERREILFLIFTFPWALHSPLNNSTFLM